MAKGRRMHDAFDRTFGDEVLEGLPRQLHTASTDLVTRTRHVHRRGSVAAAIKASARLPVLFTPIPDDDGRLLIDGGVLDNLPVDLLTERDEGPVVAVNIAMGGGGGRPGGAARPVRPRVPALGETLLRTMMIGSGGAVSAARAEGAWVVTPATLGVGLLEFHQFDRMVRAGRAAARALLEETDGLLGLAPPGDPAQEALPSTGPGSPPVERVEARVLTADEHP
jgi:predicted acylesterase/phospholipase RssA